MKPIVSILLCLAALCLAPWTRPAQAAEVRASERVLNLPEDGKDYYLTILVHANWHEIARERDLVAGFERSRALRSVRTRCYFTVVAQNDRTYREVFAALKADLPAIVLTRDDGVPLVKVSGQNLPQDPDAIATAFGQCFGTHPMRPWLDVPCPSPCPGPGPCPTPEPKPEPKPVPDLKPIPDTVLPPEKPPEKPAEPFPWALLGGAVAGCGAITAVIAFRRRVALG